MVLIFFDLYYFLVYYRIHVRVFKFWTKFAIIYVITFSEIKLCVWLKYFKTSNYMNTEWKCLQKYLEKPTLQIDCSRVLKIYKFYFCFKFLILNNFKMFLKYGTLYNYLFLKSDLKKKNESKNKILMKKNMVH